MSTDNPNAIPVSREVYDAMLSCLHLQPVDIGKLNEMNNTLMWNASRDEAIKVFKWKFVVV